MLRFGKQGGHMIQVLTETQFKAGQVVKDEDNKYFRVQSSVDVKWLFKSDEGFITLLEEVKVVVKPKPLN